MFWFSLVLCVSVAISSFFFFNESSTTDIYTLSLHDALPISWAGSNMSSPSGCGSLSKSSRTVALSAEITPRSEEHTSELQSRVDLVCRLLLEKKKRRAAAGSGCSGQPCGTSLTVRCQGRRGE